MWKYGSNAWTSSDYGATWVSRSSGNKEISKVVYHPTDDTKIAACTGLTSDGRIQISTDSGVTWSAQQVGGANKEWRSIACSTSSLIAIGSNIRPWKSTDFGTTWSEMTDLPSSYYTNITCNTDGSKIAITDGSAETMYLSTDSGATWSTIGVAAVGLDVNFAGNILSNGSGSRLVLFNGSSLNKGVYISTNFGTSWARETAVPANNAYSSISMNSDGDLIFVNILNTPDYFYSGFGPIIPTTVDGVTTIPNSGGTITLAEDMLVTATGELTLDVTEVGNLAGGKIITVQPNGKIKLTAGRQITVLSGTLYKLKT
jgi:photosystem II stability/assembly factor-like uncharacterized protein